MNKTQKKLINEIQSFQKLWGGGYRDGYSIKRNQMGLEKYLINQIKGKNVLEIGPGGGQWSKHINLYAKSLHCVDVLSAEHNMFWEYLNAYQSDISKVKYTQCKDFSLSFIPDNSIEYVFSYGCWCHMSKTGQEEYLKSLFNKCKPGCKLCIMYADWDKYSNSEPEHIYIQEKAYNIFQNPQKLKEKLLDDCDGQVIPGRWYWIGINEFLKIIEKCGYVCENKDIDIDHSNPITIFTKD